MALKTGWQGRFYDDFEVGDTYRHPLGRTITETDISENAVANLGWDEIRLPNPVFVGDTLYAETTILDKRKSESRPYAGIVNIQTRGFKQDDTTVIEFKRTVMVYTREGSPRFQEEDGREQS
jgi:itaconyl-CoA hydratase